MPRNARKGVVFASLEGAVVVVLAGFVGVLERELLSISELEFPVLSILYCIRISGKILLAD